MDLREDSRLKSGPRPADLARLLLAAGGAPPRLRARDQQADLAGDSLRRRVLVRLCDLDPEPEALESALLAIVAEFGEPNGPTRGVCSAVLQEWDAARMSDAYWVHLIERAVSAGEPSATAGRRRGRESAP